MTSPGQQALSQVRIQSGEAQVQYAPTELAYRVQNLEMTPEGTLRAVRGACRYEPNRGGDQYGGAALPPGYELFSRAFSQEDAPVVYGVFHAGLLGGKAPTLVVRAGTKLYMHAGWARSWKVIYGDKDGETLTDEGRMGTPDCFAVVNNTIIWTNGIDPALVITYDGMVTPLGFSTRPGAVEVDGPRQSESRYDYNNSDGYSWPGRVGNVGDMIDTTDGALLAGRWSYYRAWEDVHGNISALSEASTEVTTTAQRANTIIVPVITTMGPPPTWLPAQIDLATKVDDLPRQMLVKATGKAPSYAIATRLYRTPDRNRFPDQPRLLARIAGTAPFVYADNVPDSRLGVKAKDYLRVPRFSVMTTHGGALVIAEGPRVMRSEVGFPGTFDESMSVTPDPDGAIVTALASHAGRLLAFTERSVADITDPTSPPVVLARGVGCVAARSVVAMPSGMLVWLSRDSFYGWEPDKGMVPLSGLIHRLVTSELASGSLRNAVAIIEPESREYRCAVARAGSFDNDLLLCFDGRGWREVVLGYTIADMCVTDDARYLVLFAGTRSVTKEVADGFRSELRVAAGAMRTVTFDESDIFVMGHETEAEAEPEREYIYRSAWLRGDDTAIKPINVRVLYLGMVDEVDAEIDVEVFLNGSYAADFDTDRKVKAIGVKAEDLLGELVLGKGKTHARRLYWRRVTVGIENVNTWAFVVRSKQPFHLAAFAFHASFATQGDELARIPQGLD